MINSYPNFFQKWNCREAKPQIFISETIKLKKMSPEALIFPISHFLKDLSHSAVISHITDRQLFDKTLNSATLLQNISGNYIIFANTLKLSRFWKNISGSFIFHKTFNSSSFLQSISGNSWQDFKFIHISTSTN